MIPERHQRWAFPLVAVVLGACLFLPGIGRFGLWDPHEIRIADQARDVHNWSTTHGFDVSAGGKYPQRPPLAMWLMARSVGSLGISETSARLPFAFMAILGLLVVYYLGATLFTRRAGLLAALALAAAPGYILQARQVLSDTLLVVPSATAFLGAGLLLWPRGGKHTATTIGVGAALAVVGSGLADLAGGALLGVVVPAGAAALAAVLALGYRTGPADAPASGAGGPGPGGPVLCGVGPHFPSGAPARTGYLIPLCVLGGVAVVVAGFTALHVVAATRYSALVGAMPGKAQGVVTWDYFLKQVGFSFFPMSALAPFAFGRLLFAQAPEGGRPAFAKLLVTTWAALAFFVGTLWVWKYGDLRFPALPALAVGVGVLLDEMLAEPGEGDALLGFGVALVAAILARDLFLYPEYLATNHLLETAKWPTGVNLAPGFVASGLVFGAAGLCAFALRGPWATVGRLASYALLAIALGTAATIAFVVTPSLSKHYSQKVLFDRFQALRRGGEPLAQYRVAGKGVAYYTRGEVKEIPSMTALIDYLRDQRRVFVIVSAEELGQLDQQSRAAGVAYNVIDDTSSRFLLVSNRLGAGEQDRNALRALVRQEPPTPQHRVVADFDGKIGLLGYDLPAEVSRGHKFTIKLHFQVKAKPPSGYKIFLHFDGPGTRFNGDHVPLDGKFPTTLWSPGDYITDPYEMMAERATTPKGQYTIWMGFWPGGDGKRIPVVSGPNDGNNRVKLGTVKVD
ncbi:MAG: glycosyltransferase family 39 protein [Deltaproteobacteria bacterium]|nr:glycosyltransferase family 39 protein [Deltaproteobacteria bacterium]